MCQPLVKQRLAIVLSLLAASATPAVAAAQGGAGVAAGAVHTDAARDAAARRTPSADSMVARRAEPTIAALLLARRDDFFFTQAQLTGLAAVAARLDSVAPASEREIEELTVHATADEWRALSPERAAVLREQARRRSALVAALHEERRRAREAALALLSDGQRTRALALERAEREAAEERLHRARNGGWGGFRGDRSGARPTPR
jgi:hypothetical protein